MNSDMMMSQQNKSKYVYCVGVDVTNKTMDGLEVKHETEISVHTDRLTDQTDVGSWVNAVEYAIELAQSQYPDAKIDLAYCKSWK